MEKKIEAISLTSLLFLLMFLSTFVPTAPAQIMNPKNIIVATTSEPETVDPARCYDTVSGELISNVYDTLIRYDTESVDEFVPCLATDWRMSGDGLTFWFRIRGGVRFHNGAVLTTADVEYSFERFMVHDLYYGPAWMILEVLFGVDSIEELGDINTPEGRTEIATKIDNSVECNATYVWFNLIETSAPSILYQIIAQPFTSILNKQWCIVHGDWPGTWDNWIYYYDPEGSPLEDPVPVMMGTGPYKFDYWEYGIEWSIVKNDNYWQGWPAPGCSGYVERVIVKLITDWTTRKQLFLAGDCDICYVPRTNTGELLGQPGIRCIYPLETLSVWAMFYNFYISATSPYIGSGTIGESGIPPNFFSDIYIRRGFACCIDYATYIEETILGEGFQPATCVIKGLPYYNPNQTKHSLNLTRAVENFKMAWGGQVWEEGFTLGLAYNTGSTARRIAFEMLKMYIESINPRFHINIFSIDWSTYSSRLHLRELPLFFMGWLADYPDPHDFVHPFMHSNGDYASFQYYNNSYVDELIMEGRRTINTEIRRQIYNQLQSIYYHDVPSISLYQPYGRHWQREWVRGWYYNPVYSGNYYYHLWKQEFSSEHEDQIIIEIINNTYPTTDLIAFRWPEPLIPGDVITPCVHKPGWKEYSVPKSTWFYFVDLCPYEMFAHDILYVFIDDETGEYEVIGEGWPPSLNGQEMWSTPQEFWDRNNWVCSTLKNFSEPPIYYGATDLNSLTKSKTISAVNLESQPGNRALIIEGHDESGTGKNATESWYFMLLNFGYTPQQITYLADQKIDRPLVNDICTRENVFNAITTLSNSLKSGDTLNVYVCAHGDRIDKNTPMESGFIKLTERGDNILHDYELNQSLSQIPLGVHINIVIQSCYSGSIMDDLWMLENVDIIITSTDCKSESYFAWFDPPLNYRYIAGLSPDPNIEDEGEEFSSGLVDGLNELKQQYQEVGMLYVKAFNISKKKDASYINHEKLEEHHKIPEKAPYPLLKMVYYLCDVNHDGRVNILDLSLAAVSYLTSPGSDKWNPEVNVNRDRVINILDLSKIATEYLIVYFD